MSREDEYQLVEACRRLSGMGMMPASDGNCSIRLDEETMLITPSGVRKEQLKPQDLVQISINDEEAGNRASSEWQMHAVIYQQHAEVKAIAHAHPVYLTAWGLLGEVPDEDLLYEASETIGKIALVPFETPGTVDLADSVAKALGAGAATVGILVRHGAVALGSGMEEALFRLERAEHLAEVAYLAR